MCSVQREFLSNYYTQDSGTGSRNIVWNQTDRASALGA